MQIKESLEGLHMLRLGIRPMVSSGCSKSILDARSRVICCVVVP